MKQKQFHIIKPAGLHPKPDIIVARLNQRWEIKSPRGNNKNTIHNILKNISQQSENVIITLFRTNMLPNRILGRINIELNRATRIKRALLITKNKKLFT